MDRDRSPDVAVYVVWSSQLGAEERHVPAAAALIPDSRAAHFWDAGQLVGKAFQPIVGTPVPSWDVWMVFDRQARWNGEIPPRPAWWEHQLHDMPPERHLDPERFARKARALEASNPPRSHSTRGDLMRAPWPAGKLVSFRRRVG